jgi:predicted nucleotidyltransferase
MVRTKGKIVEEVPVSGLNPTLRTILSQLRREFEALYRERLVKLILFGSQARGDAEDGSDIDVLVVLKGQVEAGKEIERTIDIVSRLSLENDIVVSCLFIDEDRFLSRNGPLLRNIRKEGIDVPDRRGRKVRKLPLWYTSSETFVEA